jgi:hypothetical protein
MLSRRHRKKREFLVHVAAPTAKEAAGIVEQLREHHALEVIAGNDTHFQTLEIEIAPAALREVLDKTTRDVIISHTLKEPEKC